MSDDNLIGHGACPVCGNTKARFTFSKKSLACMVCNACNVQVFARSDNSDARMRSLINKKEPVEVQKTPVAHVEPAQAAIKKVAEPEKTQVKPASWGILGAFGG